MSETTNRPTAQLSRETGRELGVRAIVLYKAIKAVVQLLLGATLLGLALGGLADRLHDVGAALRNHASSGWSARFATVLLSNATPRRLELTSLALALDGTLSSVEAWALRRGHWWGPWLVVGATGTLLPVELYEFVRHPHLGRLAILAANVVVVVYLVARARRERAR